MYSELNLGNSIFQGFNDKGGLLICGYEYGESKADKAEYERRKQAGELVDKDSLAFTFANKVPFLGEYFWDIPYDRRIRRWFELWGHPLNSEGLGDDFTKSIMQTNISNTQNHKVENYTAIASGIDGFVALLNALRPSVILFFGIQNSDFINRADNLPKIESVLGKANNRQAKTADGNDKKFRVIFQDFEQCRTVNFPHPSGSRGLTDNYIAKFKSELNELLSEYKKKRGFKL